MMLFKDRHDAGRKLAERLRQYKENCLVFGLARGGVVVAFEVAKELSLPLDVLVVRKVGAPGNEELAIGAVSEFGTGTFNEDLIARLGVSRSYLVKEVEKQRQIVAERAARYRGGKPLPEVSKKTVILVDDGIATGASMRVAVEAMRQAGAGRVVVAAPVASEDAVERLSQEADEVIVLHVPVNFNAVGSFYREFAQTRDEEISLLLSKV